MAVNLSGPSVKGNLTGQIYSNLLGADRNARRNNLELEITESPVNGNTEQRFQTLRELSGLGITLAIVTWYRIFLHCSY